MSLVIVFWFSKIEISRKLAKKGDYRKFLDPFWHFILKRALGIREFHISWLPFGTKNHEMRGPPVLNETCSSCLQLYGIHLRSWLSLFSVWALWATKAVMSFFQFHYFWKLISVFRRVRSKKLIKKRDNYLLCLCGILFGSKYVRGTSGVWM